MNFAKHIRRALTMAAIAVLCAIAPDAMAKNPWNATSDGTESQNAIRFQFFESQYGKYIPYAKPKAWGGFAEYDPVTGAPKPGYVQGAWFEANTPIPLYTKYPPTPMSAFFNFPTDTKVEEGRYKHVMMPAMGDILTDTEHQAHLTKIIHDTVANLTDPGRLTDVAMSTQQAQASSLGNAMGESARDQAASAIDFCSKYLFNFTTDGANLWNKVRNELFVPIGLLLLLPGAILSQVRAIAAAGNPVLGDVNPFEGILRSFIAIFLIPGTYLIVNYGIDLSNSITLTIAGEYNRLFNSDMYKDAVCGEIRATPVRQPSENKDHYDIVTAGMGPILGSDTARGLFEGRMLETKIEDPCSQINKAPRDRVDEAVSSGVIATRLLSNTINAGLTASWNILCAFMMAYLMYLFFVGPVVAGLWVWPMKQLRDALPNWVEGTLTLCLWSLFWNTVILIMACLKGVDETGTVMFSALNFLATASVKYAFDFAGLVKAAGQQAGQQAQSGAGAGGASGGAGAGSALAGAGAHAGGPRVAAAGSPDGAGSPGATPAVQPGAAAAHPWTPGSYSWIRSGDGGNGESGDATLAGVPMSGSIDSASGVPGVGITPVAHAPSAPANARGVGADAGVPPLVRSANPERVILPNGDFLTLVNQPGSSVTGVMDSNGRMLGTFEAGADGNSYVRLMNGDMLRIAQEGGNTGFFLTSDGVTQALRAGTFEGNAFVPASNMLLDFSTTNDVNTHNNGHHGEHSAASQHAASAAASQHPNLIIPTAAGTLFVSNNGGHGSVSVPGANGTSNHFDFDEQHPATINLPDGSIMNLSMTDGVGDVSITSASGDQLGDYLVDGDSITNDASLIYNSDGDVVGTSATTMSSINGVPFDTTVYRDASGNVVGYHSANHYSQSGGTWFDASGNGDNHHSNVHPVLALAMDAAPIPSGSAVITPAYPPTGGQYAQALDVDLQVTSLNSLLDPIFASTPDWSGVSPTGYTAVSGFAAASAGSSDMATLSASSITASSSASTYNSALPADFAMNTASGAAFSAAPPPLPAMAAHADSAGVSIVSNMPDGGALNVSNSFNGDSAPQYANSDAAPQYAYPNSQDVANYGSVNSQMHAHSNEVVQPPQSSTNLSADSIVPGNWSSTDIAISGPDLDVQQHLMHQQSQPPASIQPMPAPPASYAKLSATNSVPAPEYGAEFMETALAAAAMRRMNMAQRVKEISGDTPAPSNSADRVTRVQSGTALNRARFGSSNQSRNAAMNLLGRLNEVADSNAQSPSASAQSPAPSRCSNCVGLMCQCMGGGRPLAQRFSRKSNNMEVEMPPMSST